MYSKTANVKLCNADEETQQYESVSLKGAWTRATAGGCQNSRSTVANNPQYVLTMVS